MVSKNGQEWIMTVCQDPSNHGDYLPARFNRQQTDKRHVSSLYNLFGAFLLSSPYLHRIHFIQGSKLESGLFNDHGSRGLLLHQPASKHVLEGPSPITPWPWAAGSQKHWLPTPWWEARKRNHYHLSPVKNPDSACPEQRSQTHKDSYQSKDKWDMKQNWGARTLVEGRGKECRVCLYPSIFLPKWKTRIYKHRSL